MEKLETINKVLSDWDPIGVPDHVRITEYRDYAPRILSALDNGQNLEDVIRSILEQDIGLIFDEDNCIQRTGLSNVCERLRSVYQDQI